MNFFFWSISLVPSIYILLKFQDLRHDNLRSSTLANHSGSSYSERLKVKGVKSTKVMFTKNTGIINI